MVRRCGLGIFMLFTRLGAAGDARVRGAVGWPPASRVLLTVAHNSSCAMWELESNVEVEGRSGARGLILVG